MRRESLAVYPVVDLASLRGKAAPMVSAALRGGATMIQIRDKRDSGTAMLGLCQAILPWVREAGVPLIINDRVDLALAADADGVHLGQRDLPPARAREVLGTTGRPDLIVGVSVTTVAEARAALAAGADYLSVSPVFNTPTKTDAEPEAGLDGLKAIRKACPDAAIVAIGGITAERVAEVIAAGADGVAFISAFQASLRPENSVRAMADAVGNARKIPAR